MASGKSTTLERIMELNPTANPEFLAEFSQLDLQSYLQRLADLPYGRKVDFDRAHDAKIDSARTASDRSRPC